MGYRVGAHLVANEADWTTLVALPESLTWTVRRHEGFFGIDVQRAWKALPEPYGASRLKDVADDLASSLVELVAVRRFLAAHDEDAAFPVAPFNLGLEISRLLGTRVLTVWADDDMLDFALVSENGAPARVRLGGYALEVIWTPAECVVVPLEDEENGPPEIAVGGLRSECAALRVAPATKVEPSLHRVACEEARAFIGGDSAPLGLGSFDGDSGFGEVVAQVRA